MAYTDVAALAQDQDFALRTIAAYAQETLGKERMLTPAGWQSEHRWDMAAQPGFGDAYAYALATNVERPGNDPAVITDAQVLAGVQSIITTEAAEVPPT